MKDLMDDFFDKALKDYVRDQEVKTMEMLKEHWDSGCDAMPFMTTTMYTGLNTDKDVTVYCEECNYAKGVKFKVEIK